MNGDQEYSATYREECSSSRRRSVTSEEVENFCNNGNEKFVNTESEVPPEAKSLLLSMIASQEDILETIKHLRNTPVLDNLLHGVSPDCKFTDICPDSSDVGKLTRMRFYFFNICIINYLYFILISYILLKSVKSILHIVAEKRGIFKNLFYSYR